MSGPLSRRLRLQVFERDGYICRYCGHLITETHRWHSGAEKWMALIQVDHVVPRCKGGSDDLDNLVTSCRWCNLEKYDRVREPLPIGVRYGVD